MISDIFKLITKVVPDTNEANKIKAKIEESYNNALTEGVNADKEIRKMEMQSGSLLQRSWRPIAALIVFLALFVRFPLYHSLRLLVGWYDLNIYLPELEELPRDFYMMATAFISIYAFGRTQEKRIK